MTKDEARHHAEDFAHGLGITFYVVRNPEGDFLPVHEPPGDYEIVERVEPPAHKSAFERE